MPSGGHARSGPAPDPNSARSERRGKDGWTDLPAKREGRAPVWPLEGLKPSEKKLWALLWKKPQAVAWEKQGLQFQVAAYVRAFLESTAAGAPASLKTAVLRMEDTLGLSTVGMNALRWRVKPDEVAAARAASSAPVDRPVAVRRLRAASE